jgi:hypothetical protein
VFKFLPELSSAARERMVDKIPTAVIDLTSDNGTDETTQLYEAQNLL